MHGRISRRRTCNTCGYKMKMRSRYHRLLIHDVKRKTEIDGMGPFNPIKLDVFRCVPCDSERQRIAF